MDMHNWLWEHWPKPSELEVVQVFKKIAVFLQKNQSKYKFMHRDLSSRNVMLDPETKEVFIIDFGLSRLKIGCQIFVHGGSAYGRNNNYNQELDLAILTTSDIKLYDMKFLEPMYKALIHVFKSSSTKKSVITKFKTVMQQKFNGFKWEDDTDWPPETVDNLKALNKKLEGNLYRLLYYMFSHLPKPNKVTSHSKVFEPSEFLDFLEEAEEKPGGRNFLGIEQKH